jgi:dienelactone hydrolase
VAVKGSDWRTAALFRRMVGVSQDAQDNGRAGDDGQFLKVNRAGHAVPSVLWRPSSPVRPPVVLLAHGGSGYKTDEFIIRMARQLLMRSIAVLAIDAPFHGDRSVPGDGQRSYRDHMAGEGMTEVCEETCADWAAALDAASGHGVDTTRVGYVGLSMGSNFGIPLCAQLGDRLRCAVVGKLGLVVSGGYPSIVAASDAVTGAAQRLTAPVVMHMQWDDEVFTREGQLALFDLIGSSNKQLRARPGPHGSTHPEDEESWVAFLARHLGSKGPSNQECRP